VQHDVHTMHRARRKWAAVVSAGQQQVAVDVVDVRRGQFWHRQVPEVWDQVAVDD
jgi:hypothetical protein